MCLEVLWVLFYVMTVCDVELLWVLFYVVTVSNLENIKDSKTGSVETKLFHETQFCSVS